jgi:polygalacturonase
LRTYGGAATHVRITDPGIAGFFYYDASDTASADNDGTIIVSGSKRWKRVFDGPVNVMWFGAKGDGVTDDTVAIQNAFNSAKYVELGDSAVVLSVGQLTLPDGVCLNANNAVLKAISNQIILLNISGNNQIRGTRFINNSLTGCVGINFLAGAKNVAIERNTFECQNGFAMQAISVNSIGVENVRVTGNQFINVRYGFLSNANAEDFKRCTIADNIMVGIKADGVELNHPIHLTGLGTTPRPLPAYQSGRDIVISGNVIEGDPLSDMPICLGIGIAGATNVAVTGNVVKNFKGRGIHVEDEARHISIIGNIVDGTSINPSMTQEDGIHILGGQDIIVSNNTILNAADAGINCVAGSVYSDGTLATARNVTITGNIIRAAGYHGIILSGSSSTYKNNYVCHDNIISLSGASGLRIESSSNRMSVKNNRIISNTEYAISVIDIHPGIELENNFFEDNLLGHYSLSSLIMPINVRGSHTILSVIADGSGVAPLTTAFNLGKGANGIMTVTARTTDGAATSMRAYNVLWDGTILTLTTAWSFVVSLSLTTPSMSGTSIQVGATSVGADKTAVFDVKFNGIISLF